MEQVISSLKFSLLEKEQFNQYYELLVEENKKYNLTNITEINEVEIRVEGEFITSKVRL